MKRFLHALANGPRITPPAARRPSTARPASSCVAETLEDRRLLSAAISASSLLGRFGGGGSPVGNFPNAISGTSVPSSDSDDRVSRAHDMSSEFTTEHSIGYSMDVDIFKFKARAGHRYTFDVDRPGSSTLDSVLRLFDASGREMAINDDGAGAGETLTAESFIDLTFTASNTYFVGISGANNDSYSPVTGSGDIIGSTGRYKLIAKRYVNPDGNDTFANAMGIGKTDSKIKSISGAHDVDMFRLTASAGQTVFFDVSADFANPSQPLDSHLRLFNANGEEIASNDDGKSPFELPETGGQSFLQYTFGTSGTYYIGVSGKGNDEYNPLTGAGDKPGTVGRFTLYTTLI